MFNQSELFPIFALLLFATLVAILVLERTIILMESGRGSHIKV